MNQLIEENRRLDGTLESEIIFFGDGLGVHNHYDETGTNLIKVDHLTNMEEPVESPPVVLALTPEEITTKMRTAFDQVATGTLTVTKLKQAMQAAIDAIGD